MNASTLTTAELVIRLRAWAAGWMPTMAAVELLIAHQHWLTHPAFLANVHLTDRFAAINWDELLSHDDLGPCTRSERGVLAIACSLGGDVDINLQEALGSLDSTNRRLVANAVLAAGGVR